MHSVKSETKCITTIGTVNSRLADTPAIVKKQLNSLPTSDSCLLTRTLTRGHDGNCNMLRQFVDKAWSVHLVSNVNRALARAESEKHNESTLGRKLSLTRNKRKSF